MPCLLAISSLSLGRAWHHKLPHKLDQAQRHGYKGIELFHEDLLYFTRDLFGNVSFESCLEAAHCIRRLCDKRKLAIVSLGPFSHCEGLIGDGARERMFESLEEWMKLALTLGTSIIQIPSNFLGEEETTGDMDVIVADLIEVAERGRQNNLSFAYESLCWGTHIDTWEQSWEIVQRVNKPNFGLCLDTFNIAGRIYADPTAPSGTTSTAAADMEASITRLMTQVDPAKIFYVEVVDAERLTSPLTSAHAFYDATQKPRMSWSRNCRLFYGEAERGAYLPVRRIVQALLEKRSKGGLGFEGWVSFELFNRSLVDAGEDVPRVHAARGAEAWKRMQEDVEFEGVPAADEEGKMAAGIGGRRRVVGKEVTLDEKTYWTITGSFLGQSE